MMSEAATGPLPDFEQVMAVLHEAASQMVLELGDCGEEAVDGGVASAAAADMAVTTADTPAATAAAVAAEDGEAAVDVARLGRARALLVAGAKFSGTIDIPGIHDGVDEESLPDEDNK
eukprot:gene21417-33481_t